MGDNTYKRKDLAEKLKSTIVCEKCGSNQLSTCDTRENMSIRRRSKKCFDCGARFTTYEIHKDDYSKLLKTIEILDKNVIELFLQLAELGHKTNEILGSFDLETEE